MYLKVFLVPGLERDANEEGQVYRNKQNSKGMENHIITRGMVKNPEPQALAGRGPTQRAPQHSCVEDLKKIKDHDPRYAAQETVKGDVALE